MSKSKLTSKNDYARGENTGYNIQNIDPALVTRVTSDIQKFEVSLKTFYDGLLHFYKHVPLNFRWLIAGNAIPHEIKSGIIGKAISKAEIGDCSDAIVEAMAPLITSRIIDGQLRRPSPPKTNKSRSSLRPNINKELLTEVNTEAEFVWKKKHQDFHKALVKFYCTLPHKYCWIAIGCPKSQFKKAYELGALSNSLLLGIVRTDIQGEAKSMAAAIVKTLKQL